MTERNKRIRGFAIIIGVNLLLFVYLIKGLFESINHNNNSGLFYAIICIIVVVLVLGMSIIRLVQIIRKSD